MPLPPGVPERLAVTCNGRSALFLVRSQRVRFGGAEMTPSRFEQLAGRGDAKKWKTSIFTFARVRLLESSACCRATHSWCARRAQGQCVTVPVSQEAPRAQCGGLEA